MTDENKVENEVSTGGIIDSKYRGKYKTPDWVGTFINKNASDEKMKTIKTKNEEGEITSEETVGTGKFVLNLDDFFGLCKVNHIDTSKMEEQRDRPNAPGRIRMTLGNSLRAAARRRGGLYDLDGEWQDAPEEITGGVEPVENPDGTKIAKAKPAESEEEEAA